MKLFLLGALVLAVATPCVRAQQMQAPKVHSTITSIQLVPTNNGQYKASVGLRLIPDAPLGQKTTPTPYPRTLYNDLNQITIPIAGTIGDNLRDITDEKIKAAIDERFDMQISSARLQAKANVDQYELQKSEYEKIQR